MTEDDEDDKSLFELAQSPAEPEKGAIELDKGPFELMSEAQEQWRKQPPMDMSPPAKPFDRRAFDEQYRQLVPPKQYRSASDFAGEEADSEARADLLHQAYQVGDIDVRCPEIRALVRGLVKTFSGALLDELVNPQPKTPKLQQIRRRPRPKPKSTKLPPLF